MGGAEYARESLLIQVEVFGNMAVHFYGMTLEQYQAFAAAASPSASNPVMTDSAVDALIAVRSKGIPVTLHGSWSGEEGAIQAWTDIQLATGWDYQAPPYFPSSLTISVLTEYGYGLLHIDNAENVTWSFEPYDSASSGTAWILGVKISV